MRHDTKQERSKRRLLKDLGIASLGCGVLMFGLYLLLQKYPGRMVPILFAAWLVLTGLLLLFLIGMAPGRYWDRDATGAEELARTRQRVQEIQLQKRKEQLNALQSQINPHFLYNTLDTIRGLALEKEDREVAEMVGLLSAMFKYSMDYDDAVVTVGEEINHVRSYLQIQSIRFPNRFAFHTTFDCDYRHIQQVRIPKLVLQPIVENIFTHGFRGTSTGGQISVGCIADDRKFRIVISDNGHGIRDDAIMALNRMFQENTPEESAAGYENFGIALKNIDARVKMYFGSQYGLHVVSTLGHGTDVTVSLPVESG